MSYLLPPELALHLNSFDGTLNSLDTFLTKVGVRLRYKRELIRNQELRLRKILEQTLDGIALLGLDGKLRYVTPAILKDLGYSEDELLNTDCTFQLGHPDERTMLTEFIEDMLKCPGQAKKVKYRVKTKAGEWKWVRSNVTNLLNEPGIGALVFSYENITERVNMEKKKEIDRQNSDALMNSTNDLMWSLDTQMRLVTCNTAFINRIKTNAGIVIKPGDILLNPALYSSDKLKKWRGRYKLALSGKSFRVDDFFDLSSVGRWEETTLNPIYQDGEIIGVSCFLRDITEKKNASEIIRKNEETMAVAQSISHFGSWECYFDEEGMIRPHSLKWSDELYRICGYEPGEIHLSYETFKEIVHPDDIKYEQGMMQAAFNTNTVYTAEYRMLRKSGEVRWIRSKGRIVLRKGNKPLKMVGTAQDITERKLSELERNKLINDLIQRNKDLEQFAYIVSHNLRSPVAQILGLISIINAYGHDQEAQLKCMEGLQKSTQSLDNVIIDLNEILKVKKQISEPRTFVDFGELVDEIQSGLITYLEKEKATIETNFSEMPGLFTLKGYMYSVFYNLIVNSLKYRKRDVPPVIQIKSRMVGNKMTITFTDNGMGIDLKTNKEKVFGLYKRFTNHVEGKGIGLYMVKTQVETLGGKISVESEVNTGTTFVVEFETVLNN